MGSGESDATAGSNNDKEKAARLMVQKRNSSQTKVKQNELERPVQPGLSSDEEDGCEDDDDWMFQTFTGGKKGGQNKQSGAGNQGRPQLNKDNHRNHDLDGGLGSSYDDNSNSSPFDLPAEIMSK